MLAYVTSFSNRKVAICKIRKVRVVPPELYPFPPYDLTVQSTIGQRKRQPKASRNQKHEIRLHIPRRKIPLRADQFPLILLLQEQSYSCLGVVGGIYWVRMCKRKLRQRRYPSVSMQGDQISRTDYVQEFSAVEKQRFLGAIVMFEASKGNIIISFTSVNQPRAVGMNFFIRIS